jgi:hypothetical protein
MGCIYTLKDPRTDLVRYVGKTVVLPRIRYAQHLYNWQRSITKVNSWIQSLSLNGLKPAMEIVGEFDNNELSKKEIEIIKLYKAVGAKLCNHTAGGEGTVGYKHTLESKDKRLNSLKISGAWQSRNKRHSEIIKQLHANGNYSHKPKHTVKTKLCIGLSNPDRRILTLLETSTNQIIIFNSMREFAKSLGYRSENSVKDFIYDKRKTHLHLKYQLLENKTAAEMKKKASKSTAKKK